LVRYSVFGLVRYRVFGLVRYGKNELGPLQVLLRNSEVDEYRIARWFILIPKNPKLGIFWRTFEWKMLTYFMAI
jgi:hypothetical protein